MICMNSWTDLIFGVVGGMVLAAIFGAVFVRLIPRPRSSLAPATPLEGGFFARFKWFICGNF
jgi:hypothetical protein